jgi:hypothetical protein
VTAPEVSTAQIARFHAAAIELADEARAIVGPALV